MTELWDFLQSPPAGAAFNMALDEALLHTAAKRGRPLLRVYGWERPSVSFGYFQKFPAALAEVHEVVRRPTGGGIVYHIDDTTYTVIVPPTHALHAMKVADAYCVLHQAVAAAFQSPADLHGNSCARVSDPAQAADRGSPEISHRPSTARSARSGGLGTTSVELYTAPLRSPQGQYECFQRPVHGDVVAGGQKLAGGAQRRTRFGMLHQGSIAARISLEQLRRGFEEVLGVGFLTCQLSRAELTQAQRLVQEKYGADSWNRRLR